MKRNLFNSVWILFCLLFLSWNQAADSQTDFCINKSHLDYLYKEIKVDGKEMAVIHIYSNAPGYEYVDDQDEGYACVDDAARAAIFYLNYFKAYSDTSSLSKYYKLIEFLLYMQADNGFFYNFIWKDNSINKTFKTSIAEPNWWSWRALWALMEGFDYLINSDDGRKTRVIQSVKKSIEAIKKQVPQSTNQVKVEGITLPDWLPAQYAADQAALLIIILTDYYKKTGDEEILPYLKSLVQGVMLMQVKDKDYEFNGAFLSWQNIWHGWGNSQSFALLKAYPILKDEKIKESALLELNTFYEKLIETCFLSSFTARKDGYKYQTIEMSKFSQIAYIIRPMVFALLEAHKLTSDSTYAVKAGKAAQWFTGRNPANINMYNHENGIFFDGIENENLVNKNSGAESTIEGLLTLLKISLNPIALKKFETAE